MKYRTLLPIATVTALAVLAAVLLGYPKLMIDVAFFTSFNAWCLISVNKQSWGHGIVKSYIFKMPKKNFFYYLFSLFLILTFGAGMVAPGAPHRNENSIILLGFLLAWFTGVLDWYRLAFHETYYHNEKMFRITLMLKGSNADEIERAVERARQIGELRPK